MSAKNMQDAATSPKQIYDYNFSVYVMLVNLYLLNTILSSDEAHMQKRWGINFTLSKAECDEVYFFSGDVNISLQRGNM